MALFPGGGKPVSISHVSIDADSGPITSATMTSTSCTHKPPCALQWQSFMPPGPQIPPSLRLSSISTLLGGCIWLGNYDYVNTMSKQSLSLLCSWQPIIGGAYCSLCQCLSLFDSFFLSLSISSPPLLHSKWLPDVRQIHWRVRNGRRSQSCVSNYYFSTAESNARVVARKLFIVVSPCLWLWGSIQNPTGGRDDKNSTKKLCSEIPSPRSAGAKLYIVPFKDQIASGPEWLS